MQSAMAVSHSDSILPHRSAFPIPTCHSNRSAPAGVAASPVEHHQPTHCLHLLTPPTLAPTLRLTAVFFYGEAAASVALSFIACVSTPPTACTYNPPPPPAPNPAPLCSVCRTATLLQLRQGCALHCTALQPSPAAKGAHSKASPPPTLPPTLPAAVSAEQRRCCRRGFVLSSSPTVPPSSSNTGRVGFDLIGRTKTHVTPGREGSDSWCRIRKGL